MNSLIKPCNQIVQGLTYRSVYDHLQPCRIPLGLYLIGAIETMCIIGIPLLLEKIYSLLSSDPSQRGPLLAALLLMMSCQNIASIAKSCSFNYYVREAQACMTMAAVKAFSQAESQNDESARLLSLLNVQIPTFVHNYYCSVLYGVFEILHIVWVLVFFWPRFGWSLLLAFGLCGSLTLTTTRASRAIVTSKTQMSQFRLHRQTYLKSYLDRLVDYKLSFLDSWLWGKVTALRERYLKGLQRAKMADCWCVGLWQFSSAAISTTLMSVHYLLGGPQLDILPSTVLYMAKLMTFPMNALWWNLNGYRLAMASLTKIQNQINSLQTDKIAKMVNACISDSSVNLTKVYRTGNPQSQLPVFSLPLLRGQIYYLRGSLKNQMISGLRWSSENVAYCEENPWLLEQLSANWTLDGDQTPHKGQLSQLLRLMQCHTIPIDSPISTNNYSGGQKLRVSLVRGLLRAKHLLLINSDMGSLDITTCQKILRGLKIIARSKSITILINKDAVTEQDSYVTCESNEVTLVQGQTLNEQNLQAFNLDSEATFKPIESNISTLDSTQPNYDKASNMSNKNKMDIFGEESQAAVALDGAYLRMMGKYYKSSYHILFIVSIAASYGTITYYNSFVQTSVNLAELHSQGPFILRMLFISFVWLPIILYLRSCSFAWANLAEAFRIHQRLDNQLCYGDLASLEESTPLTHQIAATNEIHSLCDNYPHHTNIFWNDLIGSVAALLTMVYTANHLATLVLASALMLVVWQLSLLSYKESLQLNATLRQVNKRKTQKINWFGSGLKTLQYFGEIPMFVAKLDAATRHSLTVDGQMIDLSCSVNLIQKTATLVFIGLVLASMDNSTSQHLPVFMTASIAATESLFYLINSISKVMSQSVAIFKLAPYLEEDSHPKTMKSENRAQTVKKNIQLAFNYDNPLRNAKVYVPQELMKMSNCSFEYRQGSPILSGASLSVSRGETIKIIGPTGSGKTTLFKLITSAYSTESIKLSCHIAFSPQHPLILPDPKAQSRVANLEENLNPYGVKYQIGSLPEDAQLVINRLMNKQKLLQEDWLSVNNLRAYLLGRGGLCIYDEPACILGGQNEGIIFVSHHRPFQAKNKYELMNGKLVEK